MRAVSTMVAFVLTLVSLGLTPECFCHVPVAVTEAAADPHACCKGGGERPEPPPEAPRVGATCDLGCCAPAAALAEAQPPVRAEAAAPAWVLALPAPPLAEADAAPAAAFVTAAAARGPPPGPPGRRLAHLQIWRC